MSAAAVTQVADMDPKDRYVVEGGALSTASEDVGEGIHSSENDTNPPIDSVYMICGVLIAMVLVGVIIVLLAVTISKLRKREDHEHHHHHHHNNNVGGGGGCHNNTVHPVEQVQTIATANAGIVNPAMSRSSDAVDSCCNNNAVVDSVVNNNVSINNHINDNINNNSGSCANTIVTALNGNVQQQESNPMVYTTTTAEQFIWQFPPPYPSPNTPPPQYTLYNDQDTLVHGLQGTDRQESFAKGFRKNIGGRWRRLVKKKPESETCAIPPELKDQLKTIYVY